MQYSILVIRKDEDGRPRPEVVQCENKRDLQKRVRDAGLRPHRDRELAADGARETLQGETVFIFPKTQVKLQEDYRV
jgi:hypothetical protein